MWPSDGVEGHREWSRQCWFNDSYCGGSTLRCEEDRGGSIVFACVNETGGDEIWTSISMASC